MAEELFAFENRDVVRIRNLLLAYEQGRLNVAFPSGWQQPAKGQDVFLGYVPTSIAAGTTGTAYLCSVDGTPTITQLTDLDNTYTVFNPSSLTIPAGYVAMVREPTYGYWLALAVFGNPGVSLTVVTVDPVGSDPILTQPNITQLQVDEGSGLLLTVGASGTQWATIGAQPATTTHSGVVTTGSQTFAGAKTFNNNLTTNSNLFATSFAQFSAGITLYQGTQSNGTGYIFLASSAPSLYTYASLSGTGLPSTSTGGTVWDMTGAQIRWDQTNTGILFDSSGNQPTLAVRTSAGNWAVGATGTDSLGNTFVSGLCTSIASIAGLTGTYGG